MLAITIDMPPMPEAASDQRDDGVDDLADASAMPDGRNFICRVSMRSGIAPSRRMKSASAMPGHVDRGVRRVEQRREPAAEQRDEPERDRAEHDVEDRRVPGDLAASAPRPLTTVYWPKPQIVSQFAVIAQDRRVGDLADRRRVRGTAS